MGDNWEQPDPQDPRTWNNPDTSSTPTPDPNQNWEVNNAYSYPQGGPKPNGYTPPGGQPFNLQLDDIRRALVQGANEAQVRIKSMVDKASDYWQQQQQQQSTTPVVKESTSVEEQRIRQLANIWSRDNWRVAKDLGDYMDIVAWTTDEVWEITLETRWETRNLEVVTEPYTGRDKSVPRPLLPVWDYELPAVAGLKAPQTRTRLEGMDVVSCTNCNSTGHVLCSTCTGRGWVVCPDCKGRTKKRCTTCRGRGYIADFTPGEKKPFFQRTAEGMANSVGGKVSDVFDTIRQQGVPIPNPVDSDPASKGPTIPCPDCVNGEIECTCGNGKRVCSACQGARMTLCNNCGGTGKLVRHREIVRRFDLRTQTRIVGDNSIPVQQLARANGDLIYSTEVNETLHADVSPEEVPLDVWRQTVELVEAEIRGQDKPGVDPNVSSRPTLQVIELVRIPYTRVQYRYGDQEYSFYAYDSEGKEKFYAERFPARWDRVERLVKAIATDLSASTQPKAPPPPAGSNIYRVPIDVGDYSINEDEDDTFNPNPYKEGGNV